MLQTGIINFLGFVLAAAQPASHPSSLPSTATNGPEAAALATVVEMLKAISRGDQQGANGRLAQSGCVTVMRKDLPGQPVRSASLSEFGEAYRGTAIVEERLVQPTVVATNDIAFVSSPYVYVVDGKVRHCGSAQYGLVRYGAAWKVENVAWTVETECRHLK